MNTSLLRFLFVVLFLVSALPVFSAAAAEKNAESEDPATEALVSPEVAEQAKAVISNLDVTRDELMIKWLHMLDQGGDAESGDSGVLAYAPQVPRDLARIFSSAGGSENGIGFPGLLLRTLLAVVLGYAVVRIIQALMKKSMVRFDETVPEGTDGLTLAWVGFVRVIPSFVALLLFGIIATSIFLALAGSIEVQGRMFFQTVLGTVLAFMATTLVGRIIFSPNDDQTRPLEMGKPLAKSLYRAFYISLGVLLSGFLLIGFVRELGASPQTVSWVIIVLGSAVILIYIYLVFSLRRPVADGMLIQVEKHEGGWIKKQLAGFWHILALIYLLLVWFFWVGQQLTGATGQKGTFIVSMFIVPLFFFLNYLGKNMIYAAVDALNLGQISDDEFAEGTPEEEKEEERGKKER